MGGRGDRRWVSFFFLFPSLSSPKRDIPDHDDDDDVDHSINTICLGTQKGQSMKGPSKIKKKNGEKKMRFRESSLETS